MYYKKCILSRIGGEKETPGRGVEGAGVHIYFMELAV